MIEDNRIGQLLLREKVISEEDLKGALEAQKDSYGKYLGEILIDQKVIDESTFLRVLAKQFHTQYLTAEKLSKLRIPDGVLKLVPEATAEKYLLFPVQYKSGDKTLTIVMANPEDVGAVDEVKFVSGINKVKTLIGLKESVNAAIAKWYKNDQSAFDPILNDIEDFGDFEGNDGAPPASNLENGDGQLDLAGLIQSTDAKVSTSDDDEIVIESEPDPGTSHPGKFADDDGVMLGGGTGDDEFLGGMSEMPGDNNLARDEIVIEDLADGDADDEVETITVEPLQKPDTPAPEQEPKAVRRPDAKKYRLRMLLVEDHDNIRKFVSKLFGHEGFKVNSVANRDEALAELERETYDSLVIKDRDLGEGEEFAAVVAEKFPDVELCSIKDYGSAVIGETRAHKKLMTSFLETLDVLIGLLEMEGGGMKGHGYNVGKYSRLIASKLDLAQRDIDTIALVAYVHDLGKKGMPHYTVRKIEDGVEVEELMEQAEIPLKLLSSAKFPLDIKPIIRHQYERWDGSGLPDGLKEEDIPIGARILALVETFEDLTNKYSDHDAVEPTKALELIKQHSGKLFDPKLVDIFLALVRDDIYLQQMAGDKERILIVDTEVDLVTLLELRLANLGFAATSARSGELAFDKMKAELPSLVISETNLPDMTGFELIQKMQGESALAETPFVFLAKNDDSDSVSRGLGMGAEDYMIKPMKVEVIGAKINTLMSRLKAKRKTAPAAAGVSGQLSEMGIPDIIQILGAGRKTGRITLQDGDTAATIDMEDGQVVNAKIGDQKGEEAFYQLLYLTEGTFSIDPTIEVDERLITLSIDSLMLEGFRRMDEADRGPKAEDEIALDGSDFF